MDNKVEYSVYGTVDFQKLQAHYLSLFAEYIWQKESFALQLHDDKLHGSTIFGDCIEDEWFIVYILLSISSQYSNLVIKVTDNDGQFLLIEAANELVEGTEPDLMHNRVFLYQGNLHIIPQSIVDPSIAQAIDYIVKTKICTQAAKSIQNSAFKKALNFPERIKANFHIADVIIPHLAAHILYHCPELIAYIVETFYSRDALSTKSCLEMQNFDPSTNISTTAKFTRTLYAQMNSIDCAVPSKFVMPLKNSDSHKAAFLGMKLVFMIKKTCGLQMLLTLIDKSKAEDYHSHAFEFFMSRLDKMGYFRGEIVGSNLYNILKNRAKEQYLQTCKSENNQLLKLERCISQEIIDLSLLPIQQSNSDDWLDVMPADVDQMMESCRNVSFLNLDTDSDTSSIDQRDLNEIEGFKTIVEGVDQLLAKESGISGALVPGELSDDESSDEDYQPINFDPDLFLENLSTGINQPNVAEIIDTEDERASEMMRLMDAEMGESNIGREFGQDSDANLLENMLKSFSAQQGLAGPASSLIQSLGINLPSTNLDRE